MTRLNTILLLISIHAAAAAPITFETPDYAAGPFLVSSTATVVDKPFDGQGGWSQSTSTAAARGAITATAASGEYAAGQAAFSSGSGTIITAKKDYTLVDPATNTFSFDMRYSSTFSLGWWDDTDGDGLFDQSEAQMQVGVLDVGTPKQFGIRSAGFGANLASGAAGVSGNWYRFLVTIGGAGGAGERSITMQVRNLTTGNDVDFDSGLAGAQPWTRTVTAAQFGSAPENAGGMLFRITVSGAVDNINAATVSDPFTAWINSFPALTLPADRTKDADPDKDGRNNLAEFAFGSDPSQATSMPAPILSTEDTTGDILPEALLVLAVRAGAVFSGSPSPAATVDGVQYEIQGSQDLADFGQAAAPVVTPLGVWTGPAAPAGYQFQRFRLEGSNGLQGRGFLRALVRPL